MSQLVTGDGLHKVYIERFQHCSLAGFIFSHCEINFVGVQNAEVREEEHHSVAR